MKQILRLVVDPRIFLFSWKIRSQRMCGATRAQNFPCPPSIFLSSLLTGQKKMNFFLERGDHSCHIHLQGLTMPPPLPTQSRSSPIPASKSLFPNQPGACGCKFSCCNPHLASPLILPLSPRYLGSSGQLRGFGRGRGNIIRQDVALRVRAGAGSLKGSGQQKEQRRVNFARITEPFRLIRDLMREGV